MEATMNIRKKRLLDAIQQGAVEPNQLENMPAAAPPAKRLKPVGAQLSEINEMKLKVLENWELTKRKAIERLAEEIEELQLLEEQIEQRENELADRGIYVNEQHFRNYCAAGGTSAQPQQVIKSTPQCLPSTPKSARPLNKKSKISAHSTPQSNARPAMLSVMSEEDGATGSDMVSLGPNGTMVSRVALNAINWSLSGAAVTRKLLMEVFDRETLAFHTLTGKPSPAFMDCDKPLKNQLDPIKVADIIHAVTQRLQMSAKEVRSAITTKCADENKMYRQREKKRLSQELLQQQKKQEQEMQKVGS